MHDIRSRHGILAREDMVMTEAPSDAIGLSERLRDPNAAYTEHSDGDPDLGRYIRWLKSLGEEAATALDALSADNEHMAETILKLNEYLADANARALRAEQERDEALERLKPFADAAESLYESHLDLIDLWESPSGLEITADHLRAARDLVRRLAAEIEKEGE